MANQKYKIEVSAINKTSLTFNNIKKDLDKVKSAAGAVTRVVGGAALAFAGVATAIGLATKQSYEYIDAIGKTSLRTGIAVENLQAYIIAAQESGASTEEATKGFEKFARSIGDAERGLKTQLDIFDGLGVSLRDSSGEMRTTEDILRDTADGINNLGSEAERATVLANLFGRAGLRFSEIFREGSAGLDSFTLRATQLGIVLNTDIVNNVQQFNDSFNILTNQFNSLKNNVLGAFAPVLNAVVEDISRLFGVVEDGEQDVKKLQQEFKELGESIARNVIEGIASTIEATGDLIQGVQNFSRETQIAINELKLLLDPTLFDFISAALNRNSAELGLLFAEMYAGVDATKRLKNENQKLRREIDNSSNSLSGAADKVRSYGANIGELITSNISLTGTQEDLKDAVDEAKDSLINIAEPLDLYRQQLKDIEKTVDENIVSAFKKAEDTLVEFVSKGKASFKDFVNSIIQDLIRLAIRQQIIAPLFNFFNPEQAVAGAGTPSPSASNFKLASANGGGFTGFGSRSGGLDGKGGFPAILHPNETVIDHTKGNGAGAIVINQSVNFATGVQDTVKNEVLQLLPEIAETSKGAVLEAMNRGGNFRRGMR